MRIALRPIPGHFSTNWRCPLPCRLPDSDLSPCPLYIRSWGVKRTRYAQPELFRSSELRAPAPPRRRCDRRAAARRHDPRRHLTIGPDNIARDLPRHGRHARHSRAAVGRNPKSPPRPSPPARRSDSVAGKPARRAAGQPHKSVHGAARSLSKPSTPTGMRHL